MDKKRNRTLPCTVSTKPEMSSPPRSTKAGAANKATPCIKDILTRTFDLVTSRGVLPYYILAAWFAFYYGTTAPSVPAPRTLDHVVFKVLPVVYLMGLVRYPPETVCPLHDHARSYIMLGLALTAIGDGYMAYNPDGLIYWAGFSCLGYLCYSVAFYQYYVSSRWSKLMFPISLIIVGILIYLIRRPLPCVLVVAYAIFPTALGFFALSRLEMCRTGPAYLGWAGVKLFILSDFLLALNVLVPTLGRPVSDTVVSWAYYLGQLGVVLSTYTIPQCTSGETSSPSKSDAPRRSESSMSAKASPSATFRSK